MYVIAKYVCPVHIVIIRSSGQGKMKIVRLNVEWALMYIGLSAIISLFPYIPCAFSFSPLSMSNMIDFNDMIKQPNFADKNIKS